MKKVESQRSPSSSQLLRAARPKILYVEDDDRNWELAELLLKRSFDMVWARSDRAACEAILNGREQLDAVLMDIQLQGSILDGIKLTRLLRGRLPAAEMPLFARAVPAITIPIVFVTAHSGLYKEADLIAAGGDKLIPKPVDFVQLTSTLLELRAARARSS